MEVLSTKVMEINTFITKANMKVKTSQMMKINSKDKELRLKTKSNNKFKPNQKNVFMLTKIPYTSREFLPLGHNRKSAIY